MAKQDNTGKSITPQQNLGFMVSQKLCPGGSRVGYNSQRYCLGYVDTDMVRAVPQNVLEKTIQRIPRTPGTASDISRGVKFL